MAGSLPLANETGLRGQVSLLGKSFKNSPGLILSCLTSPAGELVRAAEGQSQLLMDLEHVKLTLLFLTTWHVGLVPDQG